MDPIAKIHEHSGSLINDPLWITEFTTRVNDGDFNIMESEIEAVGKEINAEVVLKPMTVVKNLELKLPGPLGFTVGEVKIKPSISFSLDQASSIVTFQENNQEVRIQYTVVEGKRKFPDAIYENSGIIRTTEAKQVIGTLSGCRFDDVSAVLNEHLTSFTYIASNELNELLSALPGTIEEKVGAIKIGSCDTLSAYSAGLLNDAKKHAFVGIGFLQNDDFIDASRPHAKLVHFTGNGSTPAMYETTASPEKAYINLVFEPEDRRALEAIIAGGQPSNNSDDRMKLFEAFRVRLNEILSKEKYDQFKAREKSLGKSSLAELMNKLNEKINSLPTGEQIAAGIGMDVALLAALACVGIFGAKGMYKLKTSLSRKLELETSEETVAVFQSLEKNTLGEDRNHDSREEKALEYQLEAVYGDQPELEKLYPLKEAQTLKMREKRDYCKMLFTMRVFINEPWRVFDMISLFANRRSFGRELERLKADGISVDRWIDQIRVNFRNEKIKQELEKEIPKKVKRIIGGGVKLAIEKIEKTNKVDSKMLFKILGIGPVDESQGKDRPMTVKETGLEFYEYVSYSQGTDARLIDWNVFARSDQLVSKKFSETERDKKALTLDVVIDVTEHDDEELEKFVAMLLFTQRHKKLDIQSVTLTSYDQIIFRFDKVAISKLLEGGKASIEFLIKKIETLKLEYNLNLFKQGLRGGSWKLRDSLIELPPKSIDFNQTATVLGIGQLGGFRFTKHGKRIDSLLVYKDTD